MNPFDDPELGRNLARLAGDPPDADAAYADLHRRVRTRQRRRAGAAGLSMAALTTVAVMTVNRSGEAAVTTRTDPAVVLSEPTTELPAPSTTPPDPASTTTLNTDEAAAAATTPVPPSASTSAPPPDTAPPRVGTQPTVVTGPPTTVGGGSKGSAAPTPTTSVSPSGPSPTPPPTTTVPSTTVANETSTTGAAATGSVTTTCFARGGSVTVQQKKGTLVVQSVQPANGFEVTKSESAGDQVDIEFRSADRRSKLEIHAESNGPRCSVEESASGDGGPGSGTVHESGDSDSEG